MPGAAPEIGRMSPELLVARRDPRYTAVTGSSAEAILANR